MDRSEKIGLGVAVAGHALLFGLLSVGFLATPNPAKLLQKPVEVSLVKDVGLEATAPAVTEPPAQSIAPEQGAPEDAAASAPEEPTPKPAPPQPAPPVSKPQPEPKPAPKSATPAKTAPAPKPVAQPKPAERPQPAPRPAAAAKPTAKPAAAAPSRTTTTRTTTAAARPAAAKGSGTSATATAQRQRGSRLGDNFLKGLTSDPSPGKAETPPAARIDARALVGIQDAISRQIQPCADRQVDPGPGANRIVTVLNLRLNRDGTLAATPTMVRQSGVDDGNDRYARRVVDLGVAAFKGCSPLRLPAEFYSTPNGGWNNINYRWQLR